MISPERAISLLNNGDHLRIVHREEICRLIHDLLKQLAAANARVAELEQDLTAQDMLIAEAKKGAEAMTDRVEQAEAQCAENFMQCQTCKHHRPRPFSAGCHYNPHDFEDYEDGKEIPECTSENSKWEWNGYSKKPKHGMILLERYRRMREALEEIAEIHEVDKTYGKVFSRESVIAWQALKGDKE